MTNDQTIPQTGDDLAQQALNNVSAPVASTSDDEATESDKLAETITALQSIIERNADQLDQVKKDMRLLREELKSVFENDSELTEATQQSEEFSNKVKERKSKLKGDATVTRLHVDISELSERKKDLEEALSNHLVNFYQLTNSTSFDTSDGDQREFVVRAAVKSKRK